MNLSSLDRDWVRRLCVDVGAMLAETIDRGIPEELREVVGLAVELESLLYEIDESGL